MYCTEFIIKYKYIFSYIFINRIIKILKINRVYSETPIAIINKSIY